MSKHRNCISCDQKKPISTFKCPQKNVLDIRIVPGDPHGAWVECYGNSYDEHAQIGKAEEHAAKIHHKYQQIKMEREERLRHFQSEVSQRVHCLEKLKKLQLQAKMMKNEEDEQMAILQRTLGLKMPYRGTAEDLQTLNKELLKSCIVPCDVNKHLVHQIRAKESNQILTSTCEKISTDTKKARNNLLMKKVSTLREEEDSLPGGRWTQKIQEKKKIPVFNKPLNDVWTGQHQIKQHHLHNENTGETGVRLNDGNELSVDCGGGIIGNQLHSINDGRLDDSNDHLIEEEGDEEYVEDDDGRLFSESLMINPFEEFGINNLHKNLIIDWCERQHKETNDGKKLEKHQYWNYRKLFMEIEREQVQKYRKKQEHRKRVLRLKIAKEKERESTQVQMSDFPEVTFVSVNENSPFKNISDRTAISTKHDNGSKYNENEEKELYRYINALRGLAKERVRISNRTLPPLCPCGPTIWDSHPETCANNCFFYKNPKAFVRALTTILANNR